MQDKAAHMHHHAGFRNRKLRTKLKSSWSPNFGLESSSRWGVSDSEVQDPIRVALPRRSEFAPVIFEAYLSTPS